MTRQFFQTVSMAAAIALGASAILQQPSYALPNPSSASYVCQNDLNGVPTTFAQVNTASATLAFIPIIRWSRGSVGHDPDGTPTEASERCQRVTGKFNALHTPAGLNQLTSQLTPSGRQIICLLPTAATPCNSITQLFTLRPGDSFSPKIMQLNNIANGFASGPLNETSADEGNISINLNEYIRQQVAEMQRGRVPSSKANDHGSAF